MTFAQFPQNVPIHIWFSPPDGEQEIRRMLAPSSPAQWTFLPQPETDPAARRRIAFDFAFQRGFQKVLLVGTDCLDLQRGLLEESWYWLDEQDIVIGPTEDGGYYLLGVRGFFPELFREIPWNTEEMFATTMERAAEMRRSCFILTQLCDIDHVEDWEIIKDRL
jgi:glycosyltransferase A (GT-A) superfamily protein (DUF2064 family)